MIVVTGATGTVGRSLVRVLTGAGVGVTAVARRPPAALPEGARHVRADLADPRSLEPALDGADAVFVLLAGDLLTSGDDPRELLDVLTASGVQRVVLLSSQGARTRPDAPSHSRLRAYEDAVRDSGTDSTVLRPGGFASNDLAWAEPIRAQRTAYAPFPDVALPVIDPADIADVAAAVLLDAGHAGRTYELTGPGRVSPRQRVRLIGDALGEPVRFVELTRPQAREQMVRFMPGRVADGTLDILGSPLPAEQQVSTDVERVLGRAPRQYAEWLTRSVDAFR
jgi:uncharacterized protein YbjT (DUF2867 family)